MPIYEYRCPNGHLFELFQRMSDPAAQVCEVCGEAPVEKLLYPVAVHFKGSGFYSTDYGRARKPSPDGAAAEAPASSDAKKAETEKSVEKKVEDA